MSATDCTTTGGVEASKACEDYAAKFKMDDAMRAAHREKCKTMVMIPSLTVKDSRAALNFYQEAFGFKWTSEECCNDNDLQYVQMGYRDQFIMFSPEGAFGCTKKSPKTTGVDMPMNLYMYCDDVDALYAQAVKAGAESVEAPNDAFWGDRICLVKDIDGYEWMFATPL